MTRKEFLKYSGMAGSTALILNGCSFFVSEKEAEAMPDVKLPKPEAGEDIFTFIDRQKGKFDLTFYRQILGAANPFKEGDKTLRISAEDEESREHARSLLSSTQIASLNEKVVYEDELLVLIRESTQVNPQVEEWSLGELKQFLLDQPEEKIKEIMPALTSDVIAFVVKLMTNEELIAVGSKVFNPLPGSQIGSKGYIGARVQPNSPTDNVEDISWQVFNAWSYAVGDVVLGTNPVSSEPESVARIENALFDIIKTFELEDTIPNCVLSHVDVQAEVEAMQPGTTGIWFQSIAGTVNANRTFDVTLEKMLDYAALRDGQYGFYAETGQGADLTNGHAEGFDMVMHESRKYGFLRALKQKINEVKGTDDSWVHVNDVAGFIGPEVFRTREQLVRCCLEDTVMGKLHGLTIGLDICSTLHMDVNLKDLDWCIEQVIPANPAYLMALPTKNDPMLSYLTTSFSNHVAIREKHGYKVNDDMWDFFKKLEVIDENGTPTAHFGDPVWVYHKYLKAKKQAKPIDEVYSEGAEAIARIERRGVPIARGYGDTFWEQRPELAEQVQFLYEDAKKSLWTEMNEAFVSSLAAVVKVNTSSADRKDYVYHPESGEKLSGKAIKQVKSIRKSWKEYTPDIQLIISDGLNARALMDDGHLQPFLSAIQEELISTNYTLSQQLLFITNGRVRAGYACGEFLFGESPVPSSPHGIVHIIGERPGSGHHNFSAYLTVASAGMWSKKRAVDHNITRVVSGISDSALDPRKAAIESAEIMDGLFSSLDYEMKSS